MRTLTLKARNLLETFGLLKPFFKAKEFMKIFTSDDLHDNTIPPVYLRVLTIANAFVNPFLKGGEKRSDEIKDFLSRNNINIEQEKSILDFGCGCGRVIRYFEYLKDSVELHGCDYNKRLINWCTKHLQFAQFKENSLTPPLPYGEKKYSLIYAISVFTHLSKHLQYAWIQELERVLLPGGHLLFTFHSNSFLPTLTKKEKSLFNIGELVVRHSSGAGSNLCSAFHPIEWIKGNFANNIYNNFDIVDHIEATENSNQDMMLLRKRLPL